jgi:3-oxoacyl-[acyl-carrier protein] reductase
MDLGLKGRVVLITGGSRGLGRATALAFAAEGAKIAVSYVRRAEDAARLVKEIRSRRGAEAVAVRADVAVPADVRRMFDRAERALGPVDILVNNAGLWTKAGVPDLADAAWRHVLDVNLTGPFLTCREAVRRWLTAGRAGCIVNVTSQAAYAGATTGHAHYAAAKAGLANFTISLAREMAARGIRVNAVAPGFMRTEMVEAASTADAGRTLARIPLGRIGDPAEVAAAVLFLASDRASYITGASLDVNGGMVMR